MQILLVLFAVSPNMHAPISYPLYALNGPGVEISSDKYVCKSFEVIVEVADRNERRPPASQVDHEYTKLVKDSLF